MIKQYETIIINSPLVTESQLKESLSKYREYLSNNGGEIVYEEDWGLKKFAYPIKKKSTGYYHLYEYRATPELVAKIETEFNRDEKILRYISVSLDKYAVEYNEKKRKSGKTLSQIPVAKEVVNE
jgi:small subunit ribosomal protein S6